MVLFCYALGNGAGSDDGDGVVGCADINKAYKTGDGSLCSTTTVDTLGEFVDEVIDSTHRPYHFEHTCRQHRHDDNFAHTIDADTKGPHPSKEVVTTINCTNHSGKQES